MRKLEYIVKTKLFFLSVREEGGKSLPKSMTLPSAFISHSPLKHRLDLQKNKKPLSSFYQSFACPFFDSYLIHLNSVGQHLLKSTDRQGLLQNEGAYGQVRGHILQRYGCNRGKTKSKREKIAHRVKKKERGRVRVPYLGVGCGFQEAETVPEALAGQT